MDIVEKIEDEVDVLALVDSFSKKRMLSAKISKLIALILNEAGAELTQEEVFDGMFENGAGSMAAVGGLLNEIVKAFYPTLFEQKKKAKPRQKK
jgi:hypothetical protein